MSFESTAAGRVGVDGADGAGSGKYYVGAVRQ